MKQQRLRTVKLFDTITRTMRDFRKDEREDVVAWFVVNYKDYLPAWLCASTKTDGVPDVEEKVPAR